MQAGHERLGDDAPDAVRLLHHVDLRPAPEVQPDLRGIGRLEPDFNPPLAVDARILRVPHVGGGRPEVRRFLCRDRVLAGTRAAPAPLQVASSVLLGMDASLPRAPSRVRAWSLASRVQCKHSQLGSQYTRSAVALVFGDSTEPVINHGIQRQAAADWRRTRLHVGGRLSRDGKWLAYYVLDSGTFENVGDTFSRRGFALLRACRGSSRPQQHECCRVWRGVWASLELSGARPMRRRSAFLSRRHESWLAVGCSPPNRDGAWRSVVCASPESARGAPA